MRVYVLCLCIRELPQFLCVWYGRAIHAISFK